MPVRVPWPIAIVIASFLCPTELSLYVAGLRLPPHRVALLLLLPIAIYRLLTRTDVRLRSFDWAMIAFNVATVAVFSHHGMQYIGVDLTPSNGLVYGGSLALESCASFLVARAWIRTSDQFRDTLRLLFGAALLSGLLALPELILGQNFVHDIMQSITGYVHPRTIEQRLGLTRAYGTFDHPIHLGTFCASIMALVWFRTVPGLGRWISAGLLLLATFTALSSAPLLSLGVQGVLIAWGHFTQRIPSRTSATLVVLFGLYVGASLVMTRSPIAFVATGMTLDSWTGFYRLVIWENGLENVWANPWVGLGLADWTRPEWMASASIDAFWLVVAMRTGIPTFLLLVLAIGLLVRNVVTNGMQRTDRETRSFAFGWMTCLIALTLAGCTVHYWNALYAYFFFFLGLAGWLADPVRKRGVALNVRSPMRRTQAPTRYADAWPQQASA